MLILKSDLAYENFTSPVFIVANVSIGDLGNAAKVVDIQRFVPKSVKAVNFEVGIVIVNKLALYSPVLVHIAKFERFRLPSSGLLDKSQVEN